MGQKVWVALLGFAVVFFSVMGLIVVFCWMTHRITNSEVWSGMIWSIFTISSSYRALQHRLEYNAAHPAKANSR